MTHLITAVQELKGNLRGERSVAGDQDMNTDISILPCDDEAPLSFNEMFMKKYRPLLEKSR